jgi:hypothetical protein
MTKVPTKKSIIPAKKKAPPPPPPKKGVTKALLPTAASKKAAPVTAKPKKTAAKVDGRMFRKYTKASLFQTFTSTPVGEIRARIASSGAVAPEGLPGLSLKEVLAYLEVIENDTPEWKAKREPLPNGQKRKRGRPAKNAPAVVAAPPKAAPGALQRAASGAALPAKKPLPPPPPVAKKLPPPPKRA